MDDSELRMLRDSYRATVVYRLGGAAGVGARVQWRRTLIPTLESDAPVRALAVRLGVETDGWFYADGAETVLERSEGRWRPAVRALARRERDVGEVSSVGESVAAFTAHILPLERASKTRRKYATHRLTVLTWAVWKGVLRELVPMSTDLLPMSTYP